MSRLSVRIILIIYHISISRPERECPELSDPTHGQVFYSGRHFQVDRALSLQATLQCLFFKDEARYSCDEGFTLVGVGLVTCQASGRWSGEIILNFFVK